jgi:hypothetical protein
VKKINHAIPENVFSGIVLFLNKCGAGKCCTIRNVQPVRNTVSDDPVKCT